MKPPGAAMNLSNWIFEPVNFIKGIFRTFYLHFSPQFFFQGMKMLLNQCCYKEIHIEGTKLENITIHNQKQLETLFVKFAARDYIRGNNYDYGSYYHSN